MLEFCTKLRRLLPLQQTTVLLRLPLLYRREIAAPKPKGELVYKPGSVLAVIHLGYMLPYTSSGLPESLRGQRFTLFYLTLLQVGFTLPPMLPSVRCALTTPFHPYLLNEAVSFLWHFPWTRVLQTLSGTLPCGARTFLYALLIATAHSDCPTNSTQA